MLNVLAISASFFGLYLFSSPRNPEIISHQFSRHFSQFRTGLTVIGPLSSLARLETFWSLKLSKLDSFRALQLFRLEGLKLLGP